MSELRVAGLDLQLDGRQLLDDIHLSLAPGARCALLGPSGSGKTLLLRALLGLIPNRARLSGQLRWDGHAHDLSRHRAYHPGLGLIFQGAGQALHPLRRLGDLLRETAQVHRSGDPRAFLQQVGLTPVEHYWQRRPGELSGGQRQRALIALTLAARPRLLLADEPTASLDSVARAEILELLRRLCAERELGLLLVAHDPALVGEICDQALVLVDGRVVERGPLATIFGSPQQPWTRALVAAHSRLAKSAARPEPSRAGDCVRVQSLRVGLRQRWGKPARRLIGDISFAIGAGERVALMGASGSGKSTLGRCLVGVQAHSAGTLQWPSAGSRRSHTHAAVQMVLQDARAALNPMHRVETALNEARRAQHDRSRLRSIAELCALVEVDPDWFVRRPSALSGGQCQRVALARALVAQPQLLILDESLSALDPPLKVELIEQLERLSTELGFALLLITHDFAEARRLCARTLIMDGGRLVEDVDMATAANAPGHPATAALVGAWRETSERLAALTAAPES